jgi:putative ABC transport system permease protein
VVKFLPYLWKNLFGHRIRTLMTVGGTALLMFLFLFVASVQAGLGRLLDSRDDRLIVFQAYRFCPSSSQLPVFYEEVIRKVPGVKEVLPLKIVVNNCRASLDTVIFLGTDPKLLPKARPSLRFVSGDWSAFQARNDAGIVGKRFAERRGLAVGSTFTTSGITVQVAGVFASDEPGDENVIYTHLPLLLLGQQPEHYHVTQYEVLLADPSQAEAVATAIDAKLRDRFDVPTETKPKSAHLQNALADLIDLIAMTRWLGIVCVGVVVVLVANSVIMAAQDRVKEHAVLQTIGFSSSKIVGLMLSESCLVSLLGGAIGLVACATWLAISPLAISTEGVSLDFTATPLLLASGIALAALVGLVAGIVPAWQAGRAEITAALR